MVEDMGDGMQCINHPHNKNPGGICAFCLQDKLGKLVSSSFPLPKHASSSSSSSPSFTASTSTNTTGSLALSLSDTSTINNNSKLPFLLAKKKKSMLSAAASSSSSSSANLIYRRSKSTTAAVAYGDNFSPRKRSGFWSFLHLYSSKHHISRSNTNPTKKVDNFTHSRPRNQIQIGLPKTENHTTETATSTANSSMSKMVNGVSNKNKIDVISEEEESPNNLAAETPTTGGGTGVSGSSFGRKVSRSRSVGCGSRSFSGDFFERISNGFGDCALRRIESQREVGVVGGNKAKVSSSSSSSDLSNGNDATSMREMVRCGGIFGGFMIMTSSSSSSSASSSWVSSSAEQQHHKMGNKAWGWGFASPMRAKTCPSGKDEKRSRTITESTTEEKNTNSSPNLDAIPSLLTVRS